ncbi:ABC transporter substrate-binding protein [Paenibacillus alvei]|uniref:ABC transporter substrate-binding protein n=1 Tax=Paenibacillus alvei TaxID=44250 RepID=UPI0018CFB3DA|nr:ABC transporter substrate-binding protein [Paenibacillus alvei]MBG9736724.1 ABC transporter substrate-binding protein [Paenibacillus alvei]MBG9745629.1 ABC transporter substrate-binding protein [Paenibacillus alvei]MCY9578278.1 ABC transporter substrate-binding protein [Paenibacillus alvei]MCY9586756.1 ABC transporter substrate-binding protein [Paenibacillus alvei]
MKKTLLLLLSLTMASSLLLTACSNDSAAPADKGQSQVSSNNSSSGETQTPPVEVLTEPVSASDMSKLPEQAKKRTDTIIVGLTDPSGAFTPYFQQSGYDGNVSSILYTPLVTNDEKGLPTPGLAEKWEITEDGKTFTFHLRKGLKFSDGSPITADDVAFTWTLVNDKGYTGEEDLSLIGIVGAKEYKEGKATSIAGIKVIDPNTISVTLEKGNSQALSILGGDVLSKAYYGKDYKHGQSLDYIKNLHANPVGTGPYKLEKFIPGQEVRFVANENYFKGKAKTEHFIYKTTEGDTWQFIETGEQDYGAFTATQENIDKLKALGFLNLVPATASNYGFLSFNHEHDTFKDKRVRQALTYGLDRQSIFVDANQGAGQVANIPSPPTSWAYTEEGINPYNYDPEKAKALLDEAGWKAGGDGIREKDGKKLKLHFIGSKSKGNDLFVTIAKENYAAIGVQFEPELFADFNALGAKADSGDYDLASFSTPVLVDPADGVRRFVNGEVKGYDNPKVKELYDKGLAATDLEERKKIYKELFQVLNDDMPYIFTSYRKSVYAYNGRIQGMKISPLTGVAGSVFDWELK